MEIFSLNTPFPPHHSELNLEQMCRVMCLVICGLVIILASCTSEVQELQLLRQMCQMGDPSNPTSCYQTIVSDDIPGIKEATIPDDSIFFIETSCNGGLNLRQACSIEAAARTHPDRHINVLFLGPVTMRCLSSAPAWAILKFSNVHVYRVHLKEYFRNTPLEILMKTGALYQSRFPVYHMSDALKFLTLYKYGGIYLDLDAIVVKPLDSLPHTKNWLGRKDSDSLGTSLMAFSKERMGRKITYGVLRLLNDTFDVSDRWHNSIDIVTEVFQKICYTDNVTRMNADTCQGVEVYDPLYFYPISYRYWYFYFRRYNYDKAPVGPYAFHIWNALTYNRPIVENSLYARLIRNNCPVINNSTYVINNKK